MLLNEASITNSAHFIKRVAEEFKKIFFLKGLSRNRLVIVTTRKTSIPYNSLIKSTFFVFLLDE